MTRIIRKNGQQSQNTKSEVFYQWTKQLERLLPLMVFAAFWCSSLTINLLLVGLISFYTLNPDVLVSCPVCFPRIFGIGYEMLAWPSSEKARMPLPTSLLQSYQHTSQPLIVPELPACHVTNFTPPYLHDTFHFKWKYIHSSAASHNHHENPNLKRTTQAHHYLPRR